LIFDPNQKQFSSDYQRRIWRIGTHVVPIEITLAEICDPEIREICNQYYKCITEILTDMYVNWHEYESINPAAMLMWSGLGQKNRREECQIITEKLSKFGILPDGNGNIFTNVKYPKFDECRGMLLQSEAKIGHLRRGTAAMCCDFRVLQKPFKPLIGDLIRPYCEELRTNILELHNYALSKGAKTELHECYGRLRYKYKNNRVLGFELFAESEPLIEIPYHLHDVKDMLSAFQRFIDEIERQQDNDELIEYVLHNVDICNGCGGQQKSYERCGGMWAEIRGKRRRLAACHFGIGRGHYDRQKFPYTNNDFPMLKRMLDIRISQINNTYEIL
jgi:hypothetical protein